MIKNFYYRLIELSKFKMLEIQFYIANMYFHGLSLSVKVLEENTYFRFYLNLYLFRVDLNFSRKCDHQGVTFYLSLFNLNFDFNKYDTRHWDNELDNFEI